MASLGARRNELNGVVHNAQPGINFHLREMERDREGERQERSTNVAATWQHWSKRSNNNNKYIVIQIYGLTRESPRSAQTERRSSLKCACVCVMECYGEGWGVRAKKDGKASSVARIFKRRKAKKS